MAQSGVALVNDWLEADGLILLESWAREGYTVQDIATRVGITQQALRGWMNKYPEIKKAINNGRELVDYKVENALLKSALGYKTREVKVTAKIKEGKIVEETKETTDKEFAPNVQACQVWLYNRKPKTWKNMSARSNVLESLDEDTSIHITVERANASEGANNANMPTSSSFEEVDTDWQKDVNQSITIRGMSEEEKEETRKQKVQNGASASAHNNTTVDAHVHSDMDTTVDDDNLDYWPDDWEDEDE